MEYRFTSYALFVLLPFLSKCQFWSTRGNQILTLNFQVLLNYAIMCIFWTWTVNLMRSLWNIFTVCKVFGKVHSFTWSTLFEDDLLRDDINQGLNNSNWYVVVVVVYSRTPSSHSDLLMESIKIIIILQYKYLGRQHASQYRTVFTAILCFPVPFYIIFVFKRFLADNAWSRYCSSFWLGIMNGVIVEYVWYTSI